MSTTVHLDINADPKAHISVNDVTTSAHDAAVRVTAFHGDDTTFIWWSPEQARVVSDGIRVALDQLDTAEVQDAPHFHGAIHAHGEHIAGCE